MRRIDNLFDTFASFENLHRAARAARKRKRHKPDVASFQADLERNLVGLQRELVGLSWNPGPYHAFRIREPKPRLISAAAYRDRVVHHALCNVLEAVFEHRFIADSYANRRGKGTHRAVQRCSKFMRKNPYVLQCDIRKYFPSIDHEILKGLLRRKVKDRRLLTVADRIIDGSNTQDPVYELYPSDDMFTPLERRRGLPIGNLTSQFFANLYLDPLDQFVKRELRCRCYLRYSDDFLLFGGEKPTLHAWKAEIIALLEGLRLRMHEGKCQVCPTPHGITFLGFRHFPTHRRLVRAGVTRQRRRLKRLAAEYASGEIGLDQVKASVNAWIGHARHGSTWKLRKALFRDVTFERCTARYD